MAIRRIARTRLRTLIRLDELREAGRLPDEEGQKHYGKGPNHVTLLYHTRTHPGYGCSSLKASHSRFRRTPRGAISRAWHLRESCMPMGR